MFGFERVIAASLVLTLGVSVAGCSSSGQSVDPTDWIPANWFNKKDKLPGERHLVFPNGVPGVPEGVPPELVKGHEQATTETPPVEPAPDAKAAPASTAQSTKPKAKPKPKTASTPPAQTKATSAPAPAAPASQGQQASGAAATPWPDPTTNSWPPPNPNAFSH